MHAVWLVEFWNEGHPIQKEGIENNLVTRSQLSIDGVKFPSIICTKITRRLHASQHHHDFLTDSTVNNRHQIGLCRCRLEAAQQIITTKDDD